MFYYGYFDVYYLILVLPCVILAGIASLAVNGTFKKYSKQISRRKITGADAAARVLATNGVAGVKIERVSGNLTDHYDPKANVIRLSQNVYDSASTAAIGVAAHEAGHAVQYAQNYVPIKARAAIIPITNIGSNLAFPLMLIGILLSAFSTMSTVFIYLGLACFSLSLILQLITLPVEFNASRRALKTIRDTELLTQDEQLGARRTLTAAAMTYVAAMAVSLAQLLRLFLLFGRRRDD